MIEREDVGEVAVLRMAHGKVQALDLELLQALEAALDEVEASTSAAVVLTGSGSSFSAGVDLFRLLDPDSGYRARFLDALTSALRRLFLFPRPVVAGVNGHAIAGGLVLVCACDLRLLARGSARLGVPELSVGVPFPALVLEVVRSATPIAQLPELLYRGRVMGGDEALERGLVHELVETGELLPRALERARELAALPSQAFALAKHQLRLPVLDRLDRHGARLDAEVARQWSEPASLERIRAWLDRAVGRSG